MVNRRTVGVYLNKTHDRSIHAIACIGGRWEIRGGGHLMAPLYASGDEIATDKAVLAAVHALEARHVDDYRKGEDITAIRWGIDRLALLDAELGDEEEA